LAWTTALVLAVLKLKLGSKREEWLLLARKAIGFLTTVCSRGKAGAGILMQAALQAASSM